MTQRGGRIAPPEKLGSDLQQFVFIVGGGEHYTDHGFVGNHDGGNHIDGYNCTTMKRPKRKRALCHTCPCCPHTIYFPPSCSRALQYSHSLFLGYVAAVAARSVSAVLLSVGDDDDLCQSSRIIQIGCKQILTAT